MKHNRTKVLVLALLVSFTSPLQVNQKSYASDVLNPDTIDEIVDGKNEFTKLAMKEKKIEDKQNSKPSVENIQINEGSKEKDLDSEQAEIEEASKKKDDDSDEDGGTSFKSMLAEKKQLTQEVRNANITEQDVSFMDEFS